MDAEQHLRAGNLEEALAALQSAVRAQPAAVPARVFLFQLLCVLGQWERALTQLEVIGQMDVDRPLLAPVFRPLIQCEILRAELFAGHRSPVIFGAPEEWMSWLVQAGQLMARGQWSSALELRNKVLDVVPVTPGKIGDHSFEWLTDADSRLGPMLELILDGAYCWAPFFRIKELQVEAPRPLELSNAVWAPVKLTWTNGGTASGFVPTRYPGTETSPDNLQRLARKTDWREEAGELFLGTGQRLLATNRDHYPLLDAGKIEFLSP